MQRIVTPCAYCREPILVAFLDYAPSRTPRDIYCPKCGGRNNINKPSVLIAASTGGAFVLLCLFLVRTFLEINAIWLPLIFALSALMAIGPAAFAGSQKPGLVKYARWWVQPAPVLSDSDRDLMREFAIDHNGQYFIVGAMHFDRLGDALEYARHESSGAA
jgi:hypothetical protein